MRTVVEPKVAVEAQDQFGDFHRFEVNWSGGRNMRIVLGERTPRIRPCSAPDGS